MKIILILISAGIFGFAIIMFFSFILSIINYTELSFIDDYFFSSLFNIVIGSVLVGLPFSLYYYRNKNIEG